MADMSTIQFRAERPNHGAMRVRHSVNSTALVGVPYLGWTLTNHGCRNLPRPMLNSRRVVAMKKPFMPVKMPAMTGTARIAPPNLPKAMFATAPVVQLWFWPSRSG